MVPLMLETLERSNTEANVLWHDGLKQNLKNANSTEMDALKDMLPGIYAICRFLRSVEKTNKNSFLLMTQNYDSGLPLARDML